MAANFLAEALRSRESGAFRLPYHARAVRELTVDFSKLQAMQAA